MRVPLSWLREIIEIHKSPSEIANILTMLGHEVEEILHTEDDIVFDISITPNRPDCLSILGIARELSVGLRMPFIHTLPGSGKPGFFPVNSGTRFSILIDNPALCSRYTGRIIRNVKIDESPGWLKRRLELCSLRSINNVVDITNYVMLFTGHPLHAFDLNTLKGNLIRIGIGGKNQSIVSLDGVKRNLPEETLLIWDAERPVAIAGIIGGLDTEVKTETRDIFLEAAHFSPSSIRRSAKKLGIRTEASYRFERGTDVEGLKSAADMAVDLILELCGGELTDVLDEYPLRFEPRQILLRHERINRVIGDFIEPTDIEEILNLLGFPFRRDGNAFIVTTVSRRPDVSTEIDLIEEIVRIRGYERIPAEMPLLRPSSGTNEKLLDLEFIATALRAKGFSEAINYSFMDMEKLRALSIPDGDIRLDALELKNPLRKEESFLRTNLTISLLENLRTNIRYGIRDVRLFEIAKVFFKKGTNLLPDERLHLGMVYWSDPRPVLWKDNINPYYVLREILDGIITEFRIQNLTFKPSDEPFLVSGQAADIYLANQKIGYSGILSKKVYSELDLKTEAPVALLEIDLEYLLSMKGPLPTYRQIPRFPYIERDVAIVVDLSITGEMLRQMVLEYPTEFIESVGIFDCFRGGNIPPEKKSIGLRILYRAKDRTLTEEEVEVLHNKVVEELLKRTGGSIRR